MSRSAKLGGIVRDGLALVVCCISVAVLSSPWHMSLLAQTGERCEMSGEPGVGECDPDRGYRFQGVCYSDDGCYHEIEPCCELVE